MQRRHFLAVSGLAALTSLKKHATAQQNTPVNPDYIELQQYRVLSSKKLEQLIAYLRDAAIPAWNRLNISPVGVFTIQDAPLDLYVLLPHKTPESATTASMKLLDDEIYLKAAAPLLNAPKQEPVYQRVKSSLLVGFDGFPKVKTPAKGPDRTFQLRIYESHNTLFHKKKVHMFNQGGELDIFKKTGLDPVFFGRAVIGEKLPNLTYMLGFDNQDAKDKAWKAFLAHPDWHKLSRDPFYKDTVSQITNLILNPVDCSQI
ncbi:MAG: NIPSNAP family protein [Phycisphaerae bacterium]|nr:NIPSNAP family protein [Phycisphaerae bacterium]